MKTYVIYSGWNDIKKIEHVLVNFDEVILQSPNFNAENPGNFFIYCSCFYCSASSKTVLIEIPLEISYLLSLHKYNKEKQNKFLISILKQRKKELLVDAI